MIGRAPNVDAGLRERFRAAAAQIAWRDAEPPERAPARAKKGAKGKRPAAPPDRRIRIAHLHDEEARVEELAVPDGVRLTVDSGPVGALVLLLEVERRGPPTRLVTHDGADAPAFPQGAIAAHWEEGAPPAPYELPINDLVMLARYALA